MGRMQSELTITRWRGGLLFLMAAFALALPCAAQQHKSINEADFVNTVLPYPLAEVREKLGQQFSSDTRSYFEDYNRAIYELPEKVLSYKELSPRAYRAFLAFPMVKPTKFYVFYGAYPTLQSRLFAITPESVIGTDNPALARYASLPQEARVQDLYLWSPDSPYWYSEYSLGGTLLPFRTFFIVHLSEVDEGNTNVEVIEDRPVVRIDGRPSIDENGTPQPFEIRPVAPTTRDRTFLLSCIRQFIERGVPSRSAFNCRAE